MTEEVQLVIVGGAISLASTVGITVATIVLNYWLESRREIKSLKMNLLAELGRSIAVIGKQGGHSRAEMERLLEAAKAKAANLKTLEGLAVELGFVEKLTELHSQDA